MKTLAGAIEIVRKAAVIGLDFQRHGAYTSRSSKPDGTVVTQADRQIEALLCSELDRAFPGCNFVAEELPHPFIRDSEFTFIIDPIDGTDSFSNGMPTWSISVGLFDAQLRPIGGIVFAPGLDLLLFADVDGQAYQGSTKLERVTLTSELTESSSIFVSSRIHRQLDLRDYPGKTRSWGSCAVNLVTPAVYPGVIGAVQDSSAHAWDIAGAHAILASLGCEVRYLNGKAVDYGNMGVQEWKVEDFLVAGKPGAVDLLTKLIRRLEPQRLEEVRDTHPV